MAEYINKAEIIPTLFYDTRYGTFGECMDGSFYTFTMNEINRFIDSLPTINIIHCKECVYEDCGMCSHENHEWERHEADYFCAEGERRTE